jgi:putative transposase
LLQAGTFSDQLAEVSCRGARCLLAQAIEAEVANFLGGNGELKTLDGRQRVVRHGHLPEREALTAAIHIAAAVIASRGIQTDASPWPDKAGKGHT